jgi:RsiW-degrading membrane proteinase PrsW (M82 family)
LSQAASEIVAAYPRPHRPKRMVIAVAMVTGVAAVLIAGSLVEVTVYRSVFALVDLVGLISVALFAGGTYAVILAVDRRPERRRRHLGVAGILFGGAVVLFLFATNFVLAGLNWIGLLACIPTSAFGLWAVEQLDFHEREPWRLVLVAFGWGALVATTLALVLESIWSHAIDARLIPGPGQQVATAFSAGLLEESGKGIAVALLYLVMRDEFDGIVDGIIYGAAVGIGFNFMETILYTNIGGPAQWFLRQTLGLFFGHPTYTALIGAGFGLARQARGHQKIAAIGAGLVAAIAAHFAWDAWLWYFPHPADPLLLLISIPGQYFLMTGPFTAVVIVLLVLGLSAEGRGLRRQLEVEASLPDGAVLPVEVPVLVSPWRRLQARWRLYRLRGLAGYRWMRRLQQAQIDLAMERWHRERQEIEEPLEAELRLRDRVLQLRYRPQ